MLSLARMLTSRPCAYRVNVALWSSSASSPLQRFNLAVATVDKLPEEPSNDLKLKLYALYKQATVGKCSISKPEALDLVGRAKWDAWNALGDMNKEKAQDEYSSLVDKLAGGSPTRSSSSTNVSSTGEHSPSASNGDLASSIENHGFVVRFNRPTKKNSITLGMYETMIENLKEAAERDDVHYLALTGTGDFFSGGGDMVNFMNTLKAGLSTREAADLIRKYVAAFINFPKPAVALVNGPSMGISCTVLGLFDFVYASDKACFYAPFTLLGLNPDGCSSFTFPRAMGPATANRLLMLNEQLSAQEAKVCGFVTDVFPHATFHEETKKRLQQLSKLPPKLLQYTKAQLRDPVRADLHKANDMECDRITELLASEDTTQAIKNFFKDKGIL